VFVARKYLCAYYAVLIGRFVAHYAVAWLGLGFSVLDYPRTLSDWSFRVEKQKFSDQ